ncbi:Peptidase-S15 domain-containing protein [Mycena kentingensis (nom. inval.)]|nr:Peptidase-S15 domain-containing protein [Mycena kentingensis (nom. inval.)]
MTTTLVPLSTGVSLEVHLSPPPPRDDSTNKLAVCLHPWSWLGGRMNDPVLHSLLAPLHAGGFHVLRYNSRGVGKSSGWATFSGMSEAADLGALIAWARNQIGDVTSVVVVGYSYGSLIASLQPIVPGVATSHILISYPLGVRGWLTMFRGRYEEAMRALVREPESRVLVIYGDVDEFSGVERYRKWKETISGNISWVEVKGGTHFWRGRDGDELISPCAFSCFLSVMPLPDERPRQSVANLIGRFEQQKKRQSLSPRSNSVASNITGDSAKEEVKEKREWPPRQASVDKSPPQIVPSSSWSRRQSEGTTASTTKSNSPPVAAASLIASRISTSPQPVVPPHIDTQPFSPEPSIKVDSPATPKPTPVTPVPKPAPKQAPTAKAASVTKSPAKTAPKPVPAATPARSHSSLATAQSGAAGSALSPSAAARAKAAAAAPKPKTAASTTSTVSATTSGAGLHTPTAATLARARDSQEKAPPVKMSAAAKARMAAAAAANTPVRGKPPTRGGAAATRGTAKPKAAAATTRVKKEPVVAAAAGATAAAVVAGDIPDEEEHAEQSVSEDVHEEEVHEEEAHEEEVHEEEVHEEEVHEEEVHEEEVEESAHEEELAHDEELEAEEVEEHRDDVDVAAEPDIVSDDSHPSDVSATVVASETKDNDLEEMVNMLEGKTRPLSIASIPDDLDIGN